mmetsp:Transcript_35845/g.107227  ORF Transcript_35845/g.107227 Transcript_35845/m.107227 type:complete len:229 (+) Transcript_35845:67-753(+)
MSYTLSRNINQSAVCAHAPRVPKCESARDGSDLAQHRLPRRRRVRPPFHACGTAGGAAVAKEAAGPPRPPLRPSLARLLRRRRAVGGAVGRVAPRVRRVKVARAVAHGGAGPAQPRPRGRKRQPHGTSAVVCAAHSEHRVSTTEKKTVNTAEHDRIRLNTCLSSAGCRCSSAASMRTSAAMPSTSGGVRGSTHGSCRPFASRVIASPVSREVCCACPMVDTDLTAILK